MSGKETSLSAREVRKQFLRMESEVNRAQLANEAAELSARLSSLARETLIPFAEGSGLLAGQADSTEEEGSGKDWASKRLRWVRFGSMIWSKLRPSR